MQSTAVQFVRASRAPVQLIVVGGIFLLSYQGIAGISQTWPVLLISYGLLRLVEWTLQRSYSAQV